MKAWRLVGLTALQSQCDRYSIARVTVDGVNRYELWHRHQRRVLVTKPTAGECKAWHAANCPTREVAHAVDG